MKNSFLFQFKNTIKNTPAIRLIAIALLFFFCAQHDLLHAQGAKLSVQGILKKSNGDAVTDGAYNVTFKLYTVESGGSALWTETQNNVDVISGVYSTVLGNTTALNIPFNQIYYLGVTVGSTEMTPRIQLTSAPYALALIGTTNQFPSSGQVIADSTKVTWGVTARGGIPVNANGRHQGYTFSGNTGDSDSGMGSTGNGHVALYVNNTTMLTATPDSVALRNDLRLNNGGNINYNGLDDWRLVDVDYFQNDTEGWLAYNPDANEWMGWHNANNGVNPTLSGVNNHFEGRYIRTVESDQVLKKSFNLSNVGAYNFIKVKFRYYFLDSWGADDIHDAAFGAIAESASGTGMVIGYMKEKSYTGGFQDFNTTGFQNANKWGGNSSYSDFIDNGEMTFFKCNSCNNIFWLMFGASLNQVASDENLGIGMIEIWVK